MQPYLVLFHETSHMSYFAQRLTSLLRCYGWLRCHGKFSTNHVH